MIAIDTSVLVDYFQGVDNVNTRKVDEIFSGHSLALPPVVLTEILSDRFLPENFIKQMLELPVLELSSDYWQKAGQMRALLIGKKLKARLADTLIAQSCIDHQIPLLTNNSDFRHFVKHCGLILL